MIFPKVFGVHTFMRYENNSNATKIMIIGGVHGDETVAHQMTRYLRYFLDEHHINCTNDIYFLETYNSYGCAKKVIGNAHNVDLNRNFPTQNWEYADTEGRNYRGRFRASEPETKSMIDAFAEIEPHLIITIHNPIDTPYDCVDYDGSLTQLHDILSRISKILELPIQQLGARPGSMGTYFGKEQSTPLITLEIPKNKSDEWLRAKAKLLGEYLLTPLHL